MRFPFTTGLVGDVLCAFHQRISALVSARSVEQLRRSLGVAGSNLHLSADLRVDFPERMRTGDWVHVGPECQFYCRGGLHIADHVIIGPRVTIMTSMHNYREARFVPYDETEVLSPVEIGVACWIGFGAMFLPGVNLGAGCIVGAGAVLTKSFPEGSIVAGNPAKIIGSRDMAQFSRKLEAGATYLMQKKLQNLVKIEKQI